MIATRDRPEVFAGALESVLAQDLERCEVIVVDDGTASEYVDQYAQVLERAHSRLGSRLQTCTLRRTANGHGSSFARNRGADLARGAYLAFLDDDDAWTDANYLARSLAVLDACEQAGQPADLLMSNQLAVNRAQGVTSGGWLDAMEAQLKAGGAAARPDGNYRVEIADLLRTGSFCHLNCLIVRRSLFERVGALDERIRWIHDHDLFLRLMDEAGLMLHSPRIIAQHNIPDPTIHATVTTSMSFYQQRLEQLRIFDKAAIFARSQDIRAYGRRFTGYILKRLAQEAARQADWRLAMHLAWQAMGVLPTIKWAGFAGYCTARSMVAAVRHGGARKE